MRILNRYLARQVIIATIIVIFIFVGINFFVYFAAELTDIGKAHYTIVSALCYVLLQTPYMFYQLFPMAALMGVMLGLGQLANSNQLIAMRAAGYSVLQAVFAILQAGIILLCVVTYIGEGWSPQLLRISQSIKDHAMGADQQTHLLNDVWLHQKNHFIYIGSIDDAEHLSNVRIYEFKNKQTLQSIAIADHAVNKGGIWQLQDTQETLFLPNKIESKNLGNVLIKMNVRPHLISQQNVAPEQLSLRALDDVVTYRKHAGLAYTSMAYAFWVRILQPITTLVMMCFALPFVFHGTQRNVGLGQRVVLGVSFGFGFYMLNQFLGLFSMVFHISPLFAAALPTMLFTVLLIYLLMRMR